MCQKKGAFIITLRPYYAQRVKNDQNTENGEIIKINKMWKRWKNENHQNAKSEEMKKWKNSTSWKSVKIGGGMSLKGVNVTLCEIRGIWSGHFCKTAWTPVFCVFGLRTGFHNFWWFLTLFTHFKFSLFDDLWFSDFVNFVDFWFLSILMILLICDFWWFLVNFCCWHYFWSLFVSKLGAPMMTHFLPSIPALPLSPLLVVKFDHILWH